MDVCANVTNGVLDFNLSVNIDVLPRSTALGGHYIHVFLLYNIAQYMPVCSQPSSCILRTPDTTKCVIVRYLRLLFTEL